MEGYLTEFQGLQDWKTAGFMVRTRNSPGTPSRTNLEPPRMRKPCTILPGSAASGSSPKRYRASVWSHPLEPLPLFMASRKWTVVGLFPVHYHTSNKLFIIIVSSRYDFLSRPQLCIRHPRTDISVISNYHNGDQSPAAVNIRSTVWNTVIF